MNLSRRHGDQAPVDEFPAIVSGSSRGQASHSGGCCSATPRPIKKQCQCALCALVSSFNNLLRSNSCICVQEQHSQELGVDHLVDIFVAATRDVHGWISQVDRRSQVRSWVWYSRGTCFCCLQRLERNSNGWTLRSELGRRNTTKEAIPYSPSITASSNLFSSTRCDACYSPTLTPPSHD